MVTNKMVKEAEVRAKKEISMSRAKGPPSNLDHDPAYPYYHLNLVKMMKYLRYYTISTYPDSFAYNFLQGRLLISLFVLHTLLLLQYSWWQHSLKCTVLVSHI